MKALLYAIFILILANVAVSVSALEAYEIEIDLDSSGVAFVKNLFSIDSGGKTEFFIPAYNPSNIRVYDSAGDLQFNLPRGEILVKLREQKENYGFAAEYETDSLTYKNESIWKVSYDFFKTKEFDSIGLTLRLPENTKLIAFSSGGIVYSENGFINIDWDLTNTVSTTIEAEYTFETNKDQGSNVYFIVVLPVAIFMVIMITILLFLKKFKQKKKDKKFKKIEDIKKIKENIEVIKPVESKDFSQRQKDLLKTLTENEKKIIEELFKNKEGLVQKKLSLDTGIPKATMSRTLKKLQSRNFVEIRIYGNTNKILLTEFFLKKD